VWIADICAREKGFCLEQMAQHGLLISQRKRARHTVLLLQPTGTIEVKNDKWKKNKGIFFYSDKNFKNAIIPLDVVQ